MFSLCSHSIFVCVRTCVHTHVHIHVEARRQPWALPLRSHLFCSLDSVSHWPGAHLSGQPSKDASVSASPSPGLQIYIAMPGFFMWVPGSLCSHSQHSTDWESPVIGFGLSYIRNLGETLFSTYSYRLGFGCVHGHAFVECYSVYSEHCRAGSYN